MEEDVAEMVAGGTEGEGELLVEAAVEEVVAEKMGVGEADEAEASDCACLARFLAAALVCQPQNEAKQMDEEEKVGKLTLGQFSRSY